MSITLKSHFNNCFKTKQRPYNKSIFLLIIFLLLRIDSSSAQCASPLFTESGLAFGYSKENVSTTFRGDFDIFPFTGITHLNWVEMDTGSFPANHTLYMDAVYLDNELRVFTTAQMDNYEANEILRDPAILIHLACNDSSTLGFRYKVTFLQENHHRPIFSESAYDFKIPTPVFSGFELTTFEGYEIFVTDIDLYYNNITFTINGIDNNNNNLVEIRSRMNYDYRKRTYAAITLTQQLLTINEPLTFNITATDNSPIDPFTSIVQLTLTSDENNKFLPPPKFEQLIYYGTLQNDEENDRTFNLEPIILDAETFNNMDITFVKENDNENFFALNINENRITVSITNVLQQLDLSNIFYLTFRINAIASGTDESGSTVIIINILREVVEIISIPQFSDTIYHGQIDRDLQFSIAQEVRLNEMITANDIDVFLEGDDSQWFIIEHDNEFGITINVRDTLTINDLENQPYFVFTIIANKPMALENGSAIILIHVINIIDPNSIPQFEKPYYVTVLDNSLTLAPFTISIIESTYSEDVEFDMDGDDSEYFNFELNEAMANTIDITLKAPLLLSDIRDRNHFTFILQATNIENQATDKTVIIVQVPEKLCDGDQLEFENDYYNFWIMQGELKEFGIVTVKHVTENIRYGLINPNEYLQSKITINENDGGLMAIDTIMIGIYYFDVTVEDSAITTRASVKLEVMENLQCFNSNDTVENIMIIKQIDEESITDVFQTTFNDYCSYQVQGMNPSDSEYVFKNPLTNQLQTIAIDRESNAFNGMAVPQIQVVLKLFCGDEIITLPPLIDNEDDLNEVDQLSTTIDYDEDIEETTVSTVDDQQTTGGMDTEQTDDQMTIDTVTPELDIQLDITTTTIIIEQQTTQDIVIDDQNVENENVENPNVDNQDIENQIVDDDQTENELIDNEIHDIVKRNIEYHKIKSNYEHFNSIIPKAIEPGYDNRWYILTDDIPYRNDLTILTIILKDINDNAPQFVHPPYDQYLIGFPEPHIVERILPPYLMRCDAIDTDFGVNAEIRYQLNVNNHFEIDAINGIIIPIENAMANLQDSDRIELNVVAIDNAGQSNGLRTSRSISVVRLEAKHITILTVKENENENNAEKLVEFLRSQTNDNIMLLHSSFIPTHSAISRKSISPPHHPPSSPHHPHPHPHLHEHEHDHDDRSVLNHVGKSQLPSRINGQYTVLRMVLYAFNTNGQLIITEDLQRKLRAVNAEYEIASYHEELGPPITEFDDLVLIIVIAVLSVVFVVTAIGAFLMWWFLIRPYEYRKILESNDGGSNGTSISDLKKVVDDGSPLPPERTAKADQTDRDSFNISENNDVKKFNDNNNNFNIYNNNNDGHFEDDFGEITREIDKMKEDEKLERDRRAQTVTFNEMVERIDIETTVRESDDEIRI